MTMAHDLPPQTHTPKHIPTQTPLEQIDPHAYLRTRLDDEQSGKRIDAAAIESRFHIEAGVFPKSVSMLREIYLQVGIEYPSPADQVHDALDVFTERVILTKQAYDAECLDQADPTGKDREKLGEVYDLVEGLENTPLYAGTLELIGSRLVSDNKATYKEPATEAAALAAIMTLDANGIVPSFMQETEEPTPDQAEELKAEYGES